MDIVRGHITSKGEKERMFQVMKRFQLKGRYGSRGCGGKLYCGYPEDEHILFYNRKREKCQETGFWLIVICRKAVYNRNRYPQWTRGYTPLVH